MAAEHLRRTLCRRLDTVLIGKQIEWYDEIGSTNARAVELAREGAPEGAVVLAERQTRGRGRLNRRWYAPPGSSLLMSLILRPALGAQQAQRVTMLCSLGLVEAIEAVTGIRAGVKWPNDILIRGKKAAGILTESALKGDTIAYVVVGMGLNVNLDVAALPHVATPATSLSTETGHNIPRMDLLVTTLERIEALYARMKAGRWSPHDAWKARLATLGQRVIVDTPKEAIEGVAEDVDADGALLVRTPDGTLRRVLVGDVTLRGQSAV